MSISEERLRAMYQEKLQTGDRPYLPNSGKAELMAMRVGLPSRTGREIFRFAQRAAANKAARSGHPGLIRIDMELVAKAIKYAADNRDSLRIQWR